MKKRGVRITAMGGSDEASSQMAWLRSGTRLEKQHQDWLEAP